MNSRKDILIDWHPITIAAMIRTAISTSLSRTKVAKDLGISVKHLSGMLGFPYHPLTPSIAVRLGRYHLDGRAMYLGQEERRYEIERRYTTGEIERPDFSFCRSQTNSNQACKRGGGKDEL